MKSMLSSLDRSLQWTLVALMGCLVLAVTWQVASRYLLASPSSWTEEIARFLLIWIAMLGGAFAFRRNMHMGLDLLPKSLTGLSALALHRFTHAVIILFAVTVLIVGGGNLMLLTWELRQYSAALQLPIAIVYAVVPLTGLLIVIYSIAALLSPPVAEINVVAD